MASPLNPLDILAQNGVQLPPPPGAPNPNNPATLSTQNAPNGAISPAGPGQSGGTFNVGDATIPKFASKTDATAAIRTLQSQIAEVKAQHPDAILKNGQYVESTTVGGLPLPADSSLIGQTNPDTGQPYAPGDLYGGKTVNLPVTDLNTLLGQLDNVQQGQKNFLADNGSGAGQSYLSSETAKTDEVARQFKDFLARANAVYDLSAKSQDFSQKADAGNAAVEKNAQAGLSNPFMSPFYTGNLPNYAAEVAPTVPNQVLPDYQLNGAVGLPGGDGFAPSGGNTFGRALGTPAFAFGTKPKRNAYYYPQYATGTEAAAAGPQYAPHMAFAPKGPPPFKPPVWDGSKGIPDLKVLPHLADAPR